MKNYHLTQEQIAQLLEAKGYHGESFKLVPKMTDIVNAALDQVLGEPVATKLISDPYEERDGLWFDLGDIKNLKELPVGTKLYAPKESALGSLEQQPDGSVHFEEYKP